MEYDICIWNKVKHMAGIKQFTELPVQFKPVSAFVNLTIFATIAIYIIII